MLRMTVLVVAFVLVPVLAFAAEVRLYTSVDQPYAVKVIREFEKRTGHTVRMLTDAEATKTAGLAERLRAERANPRADVWWSNEVFHTIRLASEGVLAPYESPAASDIPAQFVAKDHRWTGAGVRVRVLLTAPDLKIAGYRDLLDPEIKGKIALAKPAFGTTGGHMAALYTLLGEQGYREYLEALKASGVRLVGGNATAADMVASGQMAAVFTDNDDAAHVIANGGKVQVVVPDQGDGGIGTLAMPCSVGIVAGSTNEAAARQLYDFLISRDVEQMLIAESFAHGSVRDSGGRLKFMQVDFQKVAEVMPDAINMALRILE